eukprot:TRINITY_DN4048_c0_g1_i1.p1 TRINITY_DN4048_c0_g1~~TRINITY_DN4048_c0_g1_i1.p1  ORF type:complete len:110 (-),score=9.95 TRINITY_DN4048_c0_g1_i1:101-430(-)
MTTYTPETRARLVKKPLTPSDSSFQVPKSQINVLLKDKPPPKGTSVSKLVFILICLLTLPVFVYLIVFHYSPALMVVDLKWRLIYGAIAAALSVNIIAVGYCFFAFGDD